MVWFGNILPDNNNSFMLPFASGNGDYASLYSGSWRSRFTYISCEFILHIFNKDFVPAYIYSFVYLWSCCDYCYVLENGAFIPPISPEFIVIKQFDLKEGTWEGAEKVLRSCSIKVPHLP